MAQNHFREVHHFVSGNTWEGQGERLVTFSIRLLVRFRAGCNTRNPKISPMLLTSRPRHLSLGR